MSYGRLVLQTLVRRGLVLCSFLFVAIAAAAQTAEQLHDMNQPFAAFHIIGNIYYVGASDVTSYLIRTPAGDILLDGGFAQTAPQIEANVKTLGFKLSSVKILLNSHAHSDHAGGLAELKKNSGAKLVAMDGDAKELENGGHGDFFFGDRFLFPAVTPDRLIHDGDTVSLGGTTLTAHLTPGHTRGCTTWTMIAREAGRDYHVVFVCSASVLDGYRLIDRPGLSASYPGIAEDYEKAFHVWKALPCEVFLGAHGQFFNLTAKRDAMEKGAAPNPFIDPAGYQEYVLRKEVDFDTEFTKQKAEESKAPGATPK
jgi:metallo-beta-lactamase class B